MRLLPSLTALVLLGLLTACGGERASLTVAAASDLALAFDDLTPMIEQTCGVDLVVTLGSSGQLRDQVRAGAPYDVDLSADRAYPRELEAAGAIIAGSTRDYGIGRLALDTRDGIPAVGHLDDLIHADVRHVTIASPDHAPYGRAAREALEAAGVWEAIQPRLVIAENIRQAAEYVRTGNADAGIVALSLLITGGRAYTLIDADAHAPIVQSGGVVARSEQPEAAACALDVLTGDVGQAVLARFGIEPAPR